MKKIIPIINRLYLILLLGICCHNVMAQMIARNSFHLTHDNDIFKFKNVTDRYYSFGLMASFQTSLKAKSVGFIPTRYFKSNLNKYVGSLSISIKGYTPDNLEDRTKLQHVRPFAGILTLSPSITSVSKQRLIRIAFEIGVRGPAAQAGDLQNWVHRVIGDNYVEGWDNQLENKALVNLYLDYAKPYSVAKRLEIIPESSVALGNHKTYLQQGVKFRIGMFNNISNTVSYATNIGEKHGNEIFATFSVYGRISFVDATWSNEQILRDDLPRIDKNNLVGGYQASIHLLLLRVGVSFGYNKVTPGSDLSVKHSYGSLGLNYRW